MATKCPNCGQTTERTGDWACPWCGYPLISGTFKPLGKTYRELKEEKGYGPEPVVVEEEEEFFRPRGRKARAPEETREAKPELGPAEIPEAESEREPELPVREVPEPELRAVPEPEPEAVPTPEPEPVAPELEITAEGLLSAYEREGVAADARFANKILAVSGVVHRVEVKETIGVYYVNLTSPERARYQTIRCVFDRAHASELIHLHTGQRVIVQGKYDGSIMDVRLSHCILLKR